MSRLQYRALFRFRDGYGWHKEQKLHIPDEKEMFRLLGMPVVPPEARSIEQYAKLLRPDRLAATFHYASADDDTQEFQPGLWG